MLFQKEFYQEIQHFFILYLDHILFYIKNI